MITSKQQARRFNRRRSVPGVTGILLATLASFGITATSANAVGVGDEIPHLDWSFSGVMGHYDQSQLQRGFKVYKEVCAACHGLKLLHYRNLGEEGGPGFSEAAVKALAAEDEIPAGPDDDGEIVDEDGALFVRPAKPSDRMKIPYANDAAARAANGGALPPDLSVIAKARSVPTYSSFAVVGWIKDIVSGYQEGGADYLHALLIGYGEPPGDVNVVEGMYFNAVFPGFQIAMPSPLDDDVVEYSDGSPQTTAQYAKDVSAFLMWAAEPKLEQRKALGLRVIIYLLILSVLLYLTKRSLWRRVGH